MKLTKKQRTILRQERAKHIYDVKMCKHYIKESIKLFKTYNKFRKFEIVGNRLVYPISIGCEAIDGRLLCSVPVTEYKVATTRDEYSKLLLELEAVFKEAYKEELNYQNF